MLKSLTIENFAIISDLHIDWSDGLNIVTGQTGAGKSIILGALSLLSGRKADASFLMDKGKNLVVEGLFEIKGYNLESFFEENEIDYSDEIVIRRQISPSGKSRCFIEDVPVSQTVLVSLSEKLIDVHSQNQSILLAREDFQMNLLDSIASSLPLRSKCETIYNEYSSSVKQANILRNEVEKTLKDADFLAFQTEQIDNLKILDGEISTLEERLSVIQHSEEIVKSLSEVYGYIEGNENSVSSSILSMSKYIRTFGKYMEKLSLLSSRLESTAIELKDIAEESDSILSSISFDEEEKNRVETRLDTINSVMSKHNVSTEKELIELNSQMKQQLQSIESNQETLAELDKKNAELFIQLTDICKSLSQKRAKSIKTIEKYVVSSLAKLGIPKSRFNINILPKSPSANGADEIQFLFSANELSSMQPIGKIASGGEISRVMLALKSLAAKNLKLPTIIFDEIDTGVSGLVADSMGDMIDTMAKSMQVINITHLPQVAAKGTNHYEVYKKNSQTHITRLSKEERISKIAEMISGANISQAAIEQAKLLLGYE